MVLCLVAALALTALFAFAGLLVFNFLRIAEGQCVATDATRFKSAALLVLAGSGHCGRAGLRCVLWSRHLSPYEGPDCHGGLGGGRACVTAWCLALATLPAPTQPIP